jgi:hypothetical protein
MLCYAMLCCAMLYYAMLCYAMLCYAMLCCAMLCYAMLYYAMLCYAMLCYTMLCYAILCYTMLCYAMLCHAMLYYAIPLQVVSGVYPSSTNALRNDLSHWDTLQLQASKQHSPSPGRDHVLHHALRNAMPSPTEKASRNSKGNLSAMHRIFEEKERKRLFFASNTPKPPESPPEIAQSQYRRGLRKDYMASTKTSSQKEFHGSPVPAPAARGGSGWF